MKKSMLVIFSMLSLTLALNAQKIKGSDTVLPLSQKEAESYMKANPSGRVTVTGGGSGVGISALVDGTADIAQSSRRIKFMEKHKIKESGKTLREVIVAYDALAIVIHPSNSIFKMTREQLEDIFTGKITNWKQVGGADLKIVAYSRETSSGTYEFFKKSVLKDKNYVTGIMSLPATGAIIQSIGQTKGAIGYVGVAYLNSSVKPVSVSYDAGKTFIAPTIENARNKTYPVVRPLYYYYTKSDVKIKKYIDFVLSPAGQKLVAEMGYVKAN